MKKFQEKGYNLTHICKAADRYRHGINSTTSTLDKEHQSVLFITKFNDQHWAIKKALQKHWPILDQDQAL